MGQAEDAGGEARAATRDHFLIQINASGGEDARQAGRVFQAAVVDQILEGEVVCAWHVA